MDHNNLKYMLSKDISERKEFKLQNAYQIRRCEKYRTNACDGPHTQALPR